ncbi:TatD family hydrolase [Candidatus Micrarchaeota archaeon]|nr:TatD family hydrolase [Candidatus Micrarchaeota archaeon]
MLIDAHCHLDSFKKIELDGSVLPITCGYSHSSNIKNKEIGEEYKVPYVLGIAPQTAIREDLNKLEEWCSFIRDSERVGVGETGLDFHWGKTPEDRKKQYLVFRRMLGLAEELGLPIVIHARDAIKEVLDELETFGVKRFMMHFFSGDIKEAGRAVEAGGIISIAPLHSKKRKIVIRETEIERLVVETDAPYVVPSFKDVIKAVEYIAEVKGMEFEEVGEKTAKNAVEFFNLSFE